MMVEAERPGLRGRIRALWKKISNSSGANGAMIARARASYEAILLAEGATETP